MPTIFLSYRRTDSPQACRVYEWLTRRFGNDAVFMDVKAIPFAVSFPKVIKDAITGSSVLLVLIGPQWLARIKEDDDPVCSEIASALECQVPILPVLIGTTPMPGAEDLPPSISTIATQNASTVGVSLDFDTHMQLLLPKIEQILGALAKQNAVTSDGDVIVRACSDIALFLGYTYSQDMALSEYVTFTVISAQEFSTRSAVNGVTLFLHRVSWLADSLELHFILTFWSNQAAFEQRLAGWVMRQIALFPRIYDRYDKPELPEWDLKIRRSDEDARQIWRMITSEPLRLSLAYVATISPRRAGASPLS